MILVSLQNCQSIDKVTFKFEDHGIVQFLGDNSNGKSILGKVMRAVVLQLLKYDDERLPLINDAAKQASFLMQWNNKILVAIIDRDINCCLYQLVREDGSKVTRRVREDGIDEILREFGFLVYDKRNVCLQFCETFGPMPFINTSDTCNGEIVNSVITDIPSERFIESYKATFAEAKNMQKRYKTELASIQNKIDALRIRDTTGFMEKANKMFGLIALYRLFNQLPTVNIVNLIKPEENHFYDIPLIPMPYMPPDIPEVPDIPYFTPILVKIKTMESGKCPTCGRNTLEEVNDGHVTVIS